MSYTGPTTSVHTNSQIPEIPTWSKRLLSAVLWLGALPVIGFFFLRYERNVTNSGLDLHDFILVATVVSTLVVWVLYYALFRGMVREFQGGLARRSDLNVLRRCPWLLLFAGNPLQLWNKNWRRILEEEKGERAQVALVLRLSALRASVPQNVADLRGETLRSALQQLRLALSHFSTDGQLMQDVEQDDLVSMYSNVVRAIVGQLAEEAGLAWHTIPRLQEGARPRALEDFMEEFDLSLGKCLSVCVHDTRHVAAQLKLAVAWGLDGPQNTLKNSPP